MSTPSDRSRICKIASLIRWAHEPDRAAATAPGTDAFMQRFERQVDPDNKLAPEIRAERAAMARRAYMQQLARKSAAARRARRAS